MSASDDAEASLTRLAAKRPSLRQLFSPSLEADVLTVYLAHRRKHFTDAAWVQLVWGMYTSRTLYVGNLAFTTREEQIQELASKAGRVTRVIMGLNAQQRTPCGFAFVEFETNADAMHAAACLSGLQIDGRVLRADLDQEFEPGRQFGRSRTGGQIQDDYRPDFDAARGGWGAALQARKERKDAADRHAQAQRDTFVAGGGGPDDDQPYDPTETVDRPSTRAADSNAAYKLSTSTVTALTEGVFPHYALPVDERVRKALQLVQAEAAAVAAAAAGIHTGAAAASAAQPAAVPGSADAAAAAAAASYELPPPKRPLSPVAAPVAAAPPRSPEYAAAADASPPSKRPRQHSPQPLSAPGSPQPFGAPSSPPYAAAAAAAASGGSPQPMSRSPAPQYGHRSPAPQYDAHSPGGAWSPPPERGYTPEHLSDGDRTPPPPPSPPPRDRREREEEGQLAHDDATPPPQPHPSGYEELDDDARTPQRVDNDDDDEWEREEPTHQQQHQQQPYRHAAGAYVPVHDDDATPPPEPEPEEAGDEHGGNGARRSSTDPHQPDFEEFER